MQALVGRVAILAVAVVALFGLADATQNRPDERVAGSRTTIAFAVDTHDYQRGEQAAAQALWALCSATVDGDVTALPEATSDGWEVAIAPAIGEHGERRLVGCLEDLTLDRVVGEVVQLRSSP